MGFNTTPNKQETWRGVSLFMQSSNKVLEVRNINRGNHIQVTSFMNSPLPDLSSGFRILLLTTLLTVGFFVVGRFVQTLLARSYFFEVAASCDFDLDEIAASCAFDLVEPDSELIRLFVLKMDDIKVYSTCYCKYYSRYSML